MTVAKLISVAEIAKLHGIHRATARRWLLALEDTFGPGIIIRLRNKRSAKIYTTESALTRCQRISELPESRASMRDLVKKVKEHEKSLKALDFELNALRTHMQSCPQRDAR